MNISSIGTQAPAPIESTQAGQVSGKVKSSAHGGAGGGGAAMSGCDGGSGATPSVPPSKTGTVLNVKS